VLPEHSLKHSLNLTSLVATFDIDPQLVLEYYFSQIRTLFNNPSCNRSWWFLLEVTAHVLSSRFIRQSVRVTGLL